MHFSRKKVSFGAKKRRNKNLHLYKWCRKVVALSPNEAGRWQRQLAAAGSSWQQLAAVTARLAFEWSVQQPVISFFGFWKDFFSAAAAMQKIWDLQQTDKKEGFFFFRFFVSSLAFVKRETSFWLCLNGQITRKWTTLNRVDLLVRKNILGYAIKKGKRCP